MTSDAKIGLLLGLVFIFIIAFVINGLPNLHKDRNSNELTTNMVSSQNSPPGFGVREREVINWKRQIELPAPQEQQPAAAVPPAASSPQEPVRINNSLVPPPSAADSPPQAPAAAQASPVQPAESQQEKAAPVQTAAGKVYTVGKGDTLSVIAKKFYGQEEGVKKENIEKIFQANAGEMRSIDQLSEGQKLVIPPLKQQPEGRISSILKGRLFEEVKTIGQRHPGSDPEQKPAQTAKEPAKKEPNGQTKQPVKAVKETKDNKKETREKPYREYVVRDSDSLWMIAEEQLGDGHRYQEILKLNADVIADSDNIAVGTKLKLPPK